MWYEKILPLKYEKKEKVLYILDQRSLPESVNYIRCCTVEDVAEAIKKMQIRGAPSIGIAAAYGVVIGSSRWKEAIDLLASTRPTAVNLFWALSYMKKIIESYYKSKKDLVSKDENGLKEELEKAAEKLHKEEIERNLKLVAYGAKLIKDGATIFTLCNTGALGCLGVGTALGIIYYATKEEKKKIKVYVCETRPLLQGSRLTAWELSQFDIDFTLICDSAAAFVIKNFGRDRSLALVGADRITANGDVANKIGTFSLAIACHFNKVPFYVAAPLSSFDLNIKDSNTIPIEVRSQEEIFYISNQRIAPSGIKAYNPAFDITPASLISGIITEKGILYSPYDISIRSSVKNSAYITGE
jgi:methylthioribose-1-phosphate isomerase